MIVSKPRVMSCWCKGCKKLFKGEVSVSSLRCESFRNHFFKWFKASRLQCQEEEWMYGSVSMIYTPLMWYLFNRTLSTTKWPKSNTTWLQDFRKSLQERINTACAKKVKEKTDCISVVTFLSSCHVFDCFPAFSQYVYVVVVSSFPFTEKCISSPFAL